VRSALEQIKGGKAPETDNINPDVLKADIKTTVDLLQPMLEKIWNEGKVPADWKKGLVVKLSNKVDTTNCNNWRGITLLNVPSKVLLRIILNSVKDVVELRLRKEQAGFRRHRIVRTLSILCESFWSNGWNGSPPAT
jgi:hypothetical protein